MPWYLIAGVVVGAAVLLGGGSAMASSMSKLTATMLAKVVPEAAHLADVIVRVAAEENVSPWILCGILARESAFGATLKPAGPGGTGDFAARNAAKWGMVLPPDGQGWGRGLMQLDYGSFKDWMSKNDWRDPYLNIKKGAQVLKGKMVYLKSRGITGDLLAPSIAAYNAGEGAVANAILAGKAFDSITAHGDYSAWVLAKAQAWQGKANTLGVA